MPDEEVKVFFQKIDTKKDGLITYDEFHEFAKTKPEYPKMISMLSFPEFKILKSNLELARLSSSMSMDNLSGSRNATDAKSDSSTTLTKRTKSSTDTPVSSLAGQDVAVHKVLAEDEPKSQPTKRDEIKTE
jgi:hypothetical protein